MKVKEAVAELANSPSEDLYRNITKLYREESYARIKLRSHGNKPSQSLIEGVVDEMDDWISKVAKGMGLSDEAISSLGTDRAAIFIEYKLLEPKAEKQLVSMRKAYLRGQMPIEVLTEEGLKAISDTMIGKLMQEARQYEAKALLDKPVCPHGVEARFCKHQESYFDKRIGLPRYVEDIQFFCVLKDGPEKCDWKGGGQ